MVWELHIKVKLKSFDKILAFFIPIESLIQALAKWVGRIFPWLNAEKAFKLAVIMFYAPLSGEGHMETRISAQAELDTKESRGQ